MLLNSLLDTTWYPITFDSPMNIARGVAFWLTVALAIAFVVCALVLKGDTRKKFLKISLIVAIVYACVIGFTLLILTYLKKGITLILFIPLLLLLLGIAGSAIAIFFKPAKLTFIIAGCVTGAAAIAALVCMGIYFSTGKPAEDNWLSGNEDVNQLGLYLSAALFIAVVIAATFLLGKDEKKGFDTKSITYGAICIAMSFALSYLRIVTLPQEGSITVASLLPLMIYSYMFGIKKGVFAGMIYGILQAVQDPVILHPAQFLLDYPVAFACIGFAGIFAKIKKLEKLPQLQFAFGAVVAGLARLVSHFLSGVFAFGVFAPEGTPVWLYSLTYQAGYILPDIAIVIVAGVLVFSSKTFVKQVRKFHPQSTAPADDVPTEETPSEQ